MQLAKAIQILSDSANKGITTFNQDYNDAEKLGIESLKKLREARKFNAPSSAILLPGETPPDASEQSLIT